MATVVNNSLTADESITRIHNPIMYVPDPDKGKPLDGISKLLWYCWARPRSLKITARYLMRFKEDGTAVPIDQPVIGSSWWCSHL